MTTMTLKNSENANLGIILDTSLALSQWMCCREKSIWAFHLGYAKYEVPVVCHTT